MNLGDNLKRNTCSDQMDITIYFEHFVGNLKRSTCWDQMDIMIHYESLFVWTILPLRPQGRFLSFVHQRYITGRETCLLQGMPIHRLKLSSVSENASQLHMASVGVIHILFRVK